MSKGLEAFEDIKTVMEKLFGGVERCEKALDIIEKELKQAQEDKEMLDIFKSALTIEHDLSTPSFTPLEKDKTFGVNAIITETIKVKQNELDEKMRKLLREWVLKNAFPKELKRIEELEIMYSNCVVESTKLKKAFDTLSKEDEKAKKELSKEIERVKILRDIKDRQYYALTTISDVIRDFNKGEFANAEIALQEITALLKEVLL